MRAARYVIRVHGRMSQAQLERFEDMESESGPHETVLQGPIRDQSELHGVLGRVKALGLELIEVRRLPG